MREKFNCNNLRMKTFLVWGICCSIILVLHIIKSIDFYPYDSQTYWDLAYLFGVNDFSFKNYFDDVRGYLFPFIHFILIKLASVGVGTETLNLWIFHSILFSWLFTMIFPSLCEKFFSIRIDYRVRLVFSLLCIYFFEGLIVYPLSDLTALTCACTAIYLLLKILEGHERLIIRCLESVALGALVLAAYYVRPVYLILVIGMAIVILFYVFYKRKLFFVLSIIGALFVAMPQVIVNHTHLNTYSPMVITYGGEDNSLYLKQLNWGISIQKYETTLDEDYGSPSVYYEDKVGNRLLQESGGFNTYVGYIGFVITHFMDMLCIYLKHIFNGVDIAYNDVYIKNMFENRFFIQFLNYSMVFWGIQGLLYFIKKTEHVSALSIIGIILYLLPILLVIPTAVESRFFSGLNMLFYMLGSTAFFDSGWRSEGVKNRIKTAGCYMGFIVVCFLLNSQTFNCIGVPLW